MYVCVCMSISLSVCLYVCCGARQGEAVLEDLFSHWAALVSRLSRLEEAGGRIFVLVAVLDVGHKITAFLTTPPADKGGPLPVLLSHPIRDSVRRRRYRGETLSTSRD